MISFEERKDFHSLSITNAKEPPLQQYVGLSRVSRRTSRIKNLSSFPNTSTFF